MIGKIFWLQINHNKWFIYFIQSDRHKVHFLWSWYNEIIKLVNFAAPCKNISAICLIIFFNLLSNSLALDLKRLHIEVEIWNTWLVWWWLILMFYLQRTDLLWFIGPTCYRALYLETHVYNLTSVRILYHARSVNIVHLVRQLLSCIVHDGTVAHDNNFLSWTIHHILLIVHGKNFYRTW